MQRTPGEGTGRRGERRAGLAMSRGERKQIVSVRLGTSDLEKVKGIARRLRVREADVFRFAIRATLARLSPLHDRAKSGRELMAVFADCGEDIASYFELDEKRLREIINLGAELTDKEVDRDDIAMLALSAMPDSYGNKRLLEQLRRHVDPQSPDTSLKDYLYRKYVLGEEFIDLLDEG